MIITPATIAAPAALSPGAAEFLKLRTERSKTYLNADGSRTWVGGLDALHYTEDYADPLAPWQAVDPSHYVETKEYRLYDRLPALVKVFHDRVGYEVESRVSPGHRFRVELAAVEGAEKSAWTDSADLSFECCIGTGEVRLWKRLSGKAAPKRFTWRVTEEGVGPLGFRRAPEAVKNDGVTPVIVAVKETPLLDSDGKLVFLWEEEVGESDCSIDTDVTYQVGATGNDGYIHSGAYLATTDNYDRMGTKSDGTAYNAFYRFTGVNIPAGAIITAAKLQFNAQTSRSTNTVNLRCYFNDADNASAPASYAQYNALAVTSAVGWNSVGAWTGGSWYDSPELKTILQAVIDRSGWASGNAVMALVKTYAGTAGAYRDAYDYSGSSSAATKLVVTYTAPGQPTMRRWQGVNFMRVGR